MLFLRISHFKRASRIFGFPMILCKSFPLLLYIFLPNYPNYSMRFNFRNPPSPQAFTHLATRWHSARLAVPFVHRSGLRLGLSRILSPPLFWRSCRRWTRIWQWQAKGLRAGLGSSEQQSLSRLSSPLQKARNDWSLCSSCHCVSSIHSATCARTRTGFANNVSSVLRK